MMGMYSYVSPCEDSSQASSSSSSSVSSAHADTNVVSVECAPASSCSMVSNEGGSSRSKHSPGDIQDTATPVNTVPQEPLTGRSASRSSSLSSAASASTNNATVSKDKNSFISLLSVLQASSGLSKDGARSNGEVVIAPTSSSIIGSYSKLRTEFADKGRVVSATSANELSKKSEPHLVRPTQKLSLPATTSSAIITSVPSSKVVGKRPLAKTSKKVQKLSCSSTCSKDQADQALLRGITQRPSGKWQAQLYYAGKSRYIGVFDTREKAALAYEMAREQLKADASKDNMNQCMQAIKATTSRAVPQKKTVASESKSIDFSAANPVQLKKTKSQIPQEIQAKAETFVQSSSIVKPQQDVQVNTFRGVSSQPCPVSKDVKKKPETYSFSFVPKNIEQRRSVTPLFMESKKEKRVASASFLQRLQELSSVIESAPDLSGGIRTPQNSRKRPCPTLSSEDSRWPRNLGVTMSQGGHLRTVFGGIKSQNSPNGNDVPPNFPSRSLKPQSPNSSCFLKQFSTICSAVDSGKVETEEPPKKLRREVSGEIDEETGTTPSAAVKDCIRGVTPPVENVRSVAPTQQPVISKGASSEEATVPNEVTVDPSSADTGMPRGITLRPSGRWQAQLYYAGKSRYIGVFDTREKASLAYEIARKRLKAEKKLKQQKESGGLSNNENTTEQNVYLARVAAFSGVKEPYFGA